MRKRIRVGVLRETKNPPDRRVAITPRSGLKILEKFPDVSIYVQPSDIRCYGDAEYRGEGYFLTEDLRDCDILVGVKEVTLPTLIPGHTYMFFSHTAKKQPYNRRLLQEIVKRKITLIDYEYLTDPKNLRLVAFGHWAGVVGAYKALRARGMRTDFFDLPPASDCHDMAQMYNELRKVQLHPIKILVTGGGRVAKGAMQTIGVLKVRNVTAEEFLTQQFDEPVVCRLDPCDYVERTDGSSFDLDHFFKHPQEYRSTFKRYTKETDLFIACHFWDPQSPRFITAQDYKDEDFRIRVIADVSCDLNGPIASTMRASTIADSFYGYDRFNECETIPFVDKRNVTVMAVDNLPGELPRDSSDDFSNALLERVFESVFMDDKDGIIERATIVKKGELTPRFSYLKGYLEGEE